MEPDPIGSPERINGSGFHLKSPCLTSPLLGSFTNILDGQVSPPLPQDDAKAGKRQWPMALPGSFTFQGYQISGRLHVVCHHFVDYILTSVIRNDLV